MDTLEAPISTSVGGLAFFDCEKWSRNWEALEGVFGSISLDNIVGLMLRSPGWRTKVSA